MFRIGYGNDKHRLAKGLKLIVGGVVIESDLGADGHSDADVVLHSITDALLGAISAGDIGSHFPNSDDRWKNVDSFTFLDRANQLVNDKGFSITNIDVTIELESPKLLPSIDQMRTKLSEKLKIELEQISIKAKTGEGIGEIGERKAIAATAVVLLHKK
jgi:2-C-methyl-D-erythritol 2,4-cyclodiphosphate synthase